MGMSSNVINVDPNTPEFLIDLKRRIKRAENPKNLILASDLKSHLAKARKRLTDAPIYR
jgi:hypothetical protein